MTDNMLKKHVGRTAKEMVREVYPADKPYRDVEDRKDVKRGKKYYEAAEHILNALIAGSTTLVSDMSLSLADNVSEEALKNAQEQTSVWLRRHDFDTGLNDYPMEKARFARAEGVGLPEREARTAKRPQGAEPLVGKTTTLALDFSDISKPFGGEGMEGMAKGWDGSRHRTACGHDFISVSIIGPGFADAVPVYVKIARGAQVQGRSP